MAKSSKPKEIVVVGSKIKEVVKEAGLRDSDFTGFTATKVTIAGVESEGFVFDPELMIEATSPVPFQVQVVVSPGVSRDQANGPAASLDVFVASEDGSTTSLPSPSGTFSDDYFL